MDQLRQYILAITSAAILCGLSQSLFRSNNAFSAAFKLICGLFMAIVIISPVTTVRLDRYASFWDDFTLSAQESVSAGSEYYDESLQALIKEKSESYILDKAIDMGLEIQVDVTLDQDTPPVPASAVLSGNVSPINRQRLTQQVCNDLNIPKENMTWKSLP